VQGDALAIGELPCLCERDRRSIHRNGVEAALGQPHTVSAFAVRDRKHFHPWPEPKSL
jgi:hypothetical protein